ncbi:MAG: response regulator [Pseudomonadota bacterium]
MHVLIVESRADLGELWEDHLKRQDMAVSRVATEREATEFLSETDVDAIILDLVLEEGSALTVADYANYRQPEARVIFVTSTSFFSDGSIFAHSANARAFVPAGTPPEDIAAMAEHYARERVRQAGS